ncbi:MAG: hypothetical protein AAF654_15190 [Myxococcota bacterium]
MACEVAIVGRTLLVGWAEPVVQADWAHLRKRIESECHIRDEIIVCADCRSLTEPMTGALEKDLRDLVMQENPRLLRSALLVDANEFMLQLSEVVRRAANPRIRTFYTGDMLEGWLDVVLDPSESDAVHDFLQGAPLFKMPTVSVSPPPRPDYYGAFDAGF